jgi:hypothetical protein
MTKQKKEKSSLSILEDIQNRLDKLWDFMTNIAEDDNSEKDKIKKMIRAIILRIDEYKDDASTEDKKLHMKDLHETATHLENLRATWHGGILNQVNSSNHRRRH